MQQITINKTERLILESMYSIGMKYITRDEPYDDDINDGVLLFFRKKPIKEKIHKEWVNSDNTVSGIVIYDDDMKNNFQFLKYSSAPCNIKKLLEQ